MGNVNLHYLDIEQLSEKDRRVFVYLPNEYNEETQYPVLYMFDGHNLFFDDVAAFGKSWGLKDYLDSNNIPLVVVGVDCNHIGNNRLVEYCPYNSFNGRFDIGFGLGDNTASWFAYTLKPFIEENYSVSSDRENIGIAGSSMGGLMSMYTVCKYNQFFSKAACLSSSFDLCYQSLYDDIQQCEMDSNTKIYLDYGSNEMRTKQVLANRLEQHLEINHLLQEKGCTTYPRLVNHGYHNEETWQASLPIIIPYLFNF